MRARTCGPTCKKCLLSEKKDTADSLLKFKRALNAGATFVYRGPFIKMNQISISLLVGGGYPQCMSYCDMVYRFICIINMSYMFYIQFLSCIVYSLSTVHRLVVICTCLAHYFQFIAFTLCSLFR